MKCNNIIRNKMKLPSKWQNWILRLIKSFVYKVSLADFGKDKRYWVNLNSDEVMKGL